MIVLPTMRRLLAWALPLAVLACNHPSPANEPPPQRVILEFTQGRQLADTRTLAELSQASGVRVDYMAAISTRSAAYLLRCTAADPQCSQALERLSRHAGIVHVEPDRRETFR